MEGPIFESELYRTAVKLTKEFGCFFNIHSVHAVLRGDKEFIEVAVRLTVESLDPDVREKIQAAAAPFEARFRNTTSEEDEIWP
jgi:predicted NAD-dependent protein-ADP-ribosyltransferase YbiA (DUF1768 family)